MSKRDSEIWSTFDEMKFIDNLGYKNKNGRLDSLKKYKKNLKLRVVWNDIDRIKILKHVDYEIRMEEGR